MSLAKDIPKERLPPWFVSDILEPFEAGTSSVFIVNGDINCLVSNPEGTEKSAKTYIKLRNFWRKVHKDNKIVVFYNLASGITFLKPEMEAEFKKASGVTEQNPAAGGSNPVANARADLASRRPLPTESDICLSLIDKALRNEKNIAVLIDSVHFIAPAGGGGLSLSPIDRINTERLRSWSQSETIRTNGNIVLLITDQASKVSGELRLSGNEIRIAFIPKPDSSQRKDFISIFVEGNESQTEIISRLRVLNARLPRQKNDFDRKYVNLQIEKLRKQLEDFPELYPVADDLDANTFTVATQGLSLGQIKEILVEGKRTGLPLDLRSVKEKKYQVLLTEYMDIMEVVNASKGLEDIGGMEHLKAYFRTVIEAIKQGDVRRVPMGVTLMGPPGTGKTAFVEALAKEAGFHFIKIKNIRSMWLGESEARMDKLINGIWSLVPVVIMNDEADLADADRNAPKGDSGVSERLMRTWMTFLSDPKIRGKVIVINCTNRPDRMDAALKRSGRSDKRILLPMPSVDEIPAIFEVMFRRYAIKTTIKDFSEYAKKVDGRSGSDIEAITLSALDFAGRRGQEDEEIVVDQAALKEAINDSIPSASQADIDYMTLVGLLESSSRELLPPNMKKIVSDISHRNLVENLPGILEQIRARNILQI